MYVTSSRECRAIAMVQPPHTQFVLVQVTKALPALANWRPNMGIQDVLVALRELMVPAAKVKQPAADSKY